VVGLLALTASLTLAGNVHLKGGEGGGFTNSFSPLTMTTSGALAGLGNGDVLVFLVAVGQPNALCSNPGQSPRPPGQNPAQVVLTGVQAIPDSQIKNGSVAFDVRTAEPSPNPITGAPECPNPQWTERITNVAFTSAILTVEQPAGTVVLRTTCTFNPPTSDGPVSSSTVSCTTETF
jgi:hypothetical protein